MITATHIQVLEAEAIHVIREVAAERARLEVIHETLDVGTLEGRPGADTLGLNDIGRVSLRCAAELVFDPYAENRTTGSFILIDEATNDTVGAGMLADHVL